VKYREINDLHKQMLRVSDKVVTMQEGPAKERALDHLYQGQSNDCYWHGLFGGIYISHMRLATYEHLIAAEDAADRAARAERRPVDGGRLVDTDLDGVDEVLLTGVGQVVTVKTAEGAGIGGWDIRAVRHALGAVMRRRPEAYHQTLLRHEEELARKTIEPELGHPVDSAVDTGPASIHDLVKTKEPGLSARLAYDWHERRSGLVHVFDRTATPEAVARATQAELGDFVDRPFVVEALTADRLVASRDGGIAVDGRRLPVHVRKELVTGGGRSDPRLSLSVGIENRSDTPIDALLGVEWDQTMLGGGGNPAAYHLVADERLTHDSTGARSGVPSVEAGNTYVGLSVTTDLQPPADAWWAPIETISNSESGFERIYQGSSMVFVWPLRLAPGEQTSVAMTARVATMRDHAAEEEAGA
jgi:alpha-amylase